MRVLLAGASGLIGHALADELTRRGDEVRSLVRRPPTSATEVEWDPAAGRLDPAVVAGYDAVIGLSGASIAGHRWTASYKHTLRESRLGPTRVLAAALAGLPVTDRPAVFCSASAIGYYGERGAEQLTESSPPGHGFLADLVVDWEAAAQLATDAGIRTCFLRTGLVLAASGGLLKVQLPLFKLGLGGRLGTGRQYQSWISLADEVGAICYLLATPSISGSVNLTGPVPLTNRDFSRAIAAAVHRPAIIATPALAVRLALGEFADEGALVSQRVLPHVLADSGYSFQHPDASAALAWAVNN